MERKQGENNLHVIANGRLTTSHISQSNDMTTPTPNDVQDRRTTVRNYAKDNFCFVSKRKQKPQEACLVLCIDSCTMETRRARLRHSQGVNMKKGKGITWETRQTVDIQTDRMWVTKTGICYYQSTGTKRPGWASYHNVTGEHTKGL